MSPDQRSAIYGDDDHWKVRVVGNKYPALTADEPLLRTCDGTQVQLSGFGMHEVIVESPRHDLSLAEQSVDQIARVLDAYQTAYLGAIADERIAFVTLFKNHGATAGTSLEHPHSQMIATPVVTAQVQQRIDFSRQYHQTHGRCVYCDMMAQELDQDLRVVAHNEHYVAFVLYAALSPFHMWILPRRHQSCFARQDRNQLRALADVLWRVLRVLHIGLGDPAYNFVVRSQPGVPVERPDFHWYISVVPRVTLAAGFELGSGMFINTLRPEEAAQFLRSVDIKT